MNNNTPETDALDRELHTPSVLQDRYSEMRDHAQKLERERDEALALLASEKSTRNAIIAQGVELEKQLEAMRDVLRTIREEAAKIFSATAGLPDCGLIHQIASSALAITKLQPFLND